MSSLQRYSFPNVTTVEQIVGPIPLQPDYRNTIGVAGQFRRGPRSPVAIDNLQDYVYLYGNDNSPGSIFARQVFMQGATSLIVSRAIPEATPAKSTIKLGNLLPTNEAQIGYSGNVLSYNNGAPVMTTGLRLDISYAGQAFETIASGGTLTTKTTSTLTDKVKFVGSGFFDIVAEQYLEARGAVRVATQLNNASNTISSQGALTLTTGDNNRDAATDLTFTSGSYGSLAAIPNDTEFVFSGGARIKIHTSGTLYDVITGAAVGASEVALEEKQLVVTSLNTRLESDSYLYFSDSTFKTSKVTNASNETVTIYGFLLSANPNVIVSANAEPVIQARIDSLGVLDVSRTPNIVASNKLEDSIQKVVIDRTLQSNQALLANLTPGRLLYSIDPDVDFNPTSDTPLTVMSDPVVDPGATNTSYIYVKGHISADKSACKVVLYDTGENVYVFSSTWRLANGENPSYKKIDTTTVELGTDGSPPTMDVGEDFITLSAPLTFDVVEGHEFIFTEAVNWEIDNTSTLFKVTKFAPAGSTAFIGTFERNTKLDLTAGDTGHLRDNHTYTRVQLEFEVDTRNSLVDAYVVSSEAAVTDNFKHLFYYKRSDGSIVTFDTGMMIDLGEVGVSGKIAFLQGGSFRIPVSQSYVTIGSLNEDESEFNVGTLSSQLLTRLADAVSMNGPMLDVIEVPVVGTSLNPTTFEMVTVAKGTDSNRVRYKLSRETIGEGGGVTADDLIYNSTNSVDSAANYGVTVPFTGATNGSTAAAFDFYSSDSDPLIRVRALSDGAYGNKLSVSVVPGTNGQFTLVVVDNDSLEYQNSATTETMVLSTRDVNQGGLFNASSNSRLVRVYYIPATEGKYNRLTESELNKVPMRIAPSFGDRIPILNSAPEGEVSNVLPKYAQAYQGVNYLANISLSGGDDGIDITNSSLVVSPTAMIKAVRALEQEDCAIIAAAGVNAGDGRYSGVIEELVGQINRACPMNGLRTAIIQAPRGLSVNQAQALSATLNNPNIVLVGGYITMAGVPGYNNTPVDGIYAGMIASNYPELSPAAMSEGMVPQGIISVDTPATPAYLDGVTKARTEVVFYDNGLRVFKFLNGRNTTSNQQDHYVGIRRMADQILQDLYNNLLQVRSSQNTRSLRVRVASACDAYFQNLVRNGRIASFRPTICDESNNTPLTISLGQLNINVIWSPIYPADFINVTATREIADTLSLQLS